MHTHFAVTSSPLTVDDLEQSGRFELLRQIRFADLMPFLNEFYWRTHSSVTLIHYAMTILFLGLTFLPVRQPDITMGHWLEGWGIGFLGFLVFLPIHEVIHGLVYKLFGARDIRYGILWRQAAVYAGAHHFVVERRKFFWVAVTPFLVINGLLLVAALCLPELRVLLLAMLFWHTTGTAGDFALLNYLWLNREREMYTFDDLDANVTYFYGAKQIEVSDTVN